MKKLLALLSAAVIVVGIAGCMHKNPQPGFENVSDESSSEETVHIEESGSVNIATEPTQAVVTDAQGNTVTQSGTTRYSKITLYTTRAPSPDRLTQRPTTTERKTIPPAKLPDGVTVTTKPATPTNVRTTKPATSRPTTTAKPATTAANFKAPAVEYSGVYGTDKDKVRIKSHECMLSDNNSILVTLQFEIVEASGTTSFVYIGYDCYDAAGKKINSETVRTIAPVNTTSTVSTSIATAPLNTAKIVFVNI